MGVHSGPFRLGGSTRDPDCDRLAGVASYLLVLLSIQQSSTIFPLGRPERIGEDVSSDIGAPAEDDYQAAAKTS